MMTQSCMIAASSDSLHSLAKLNNTHVQAGCESPSSSTSTRTSSRSSCPSDDEVATPPRRESLPIDERGLGHVYPEGLIVRNTFIDFEEEPIFTKFRRIRSEPNKTSTRSASIMTVEPAPEAAGAPAVRKIASIQEDTSDSRLGSPDLPSIGSEQHHLGKCKPCSFFWKPSGCTNGVDCLHCHLCDPSKLKLRRKARKTQLKTQHRIIVGVEHPLESPVVLQLASIVGDTYRSQD